MTYSSLRLCSGRAAYESVPTPRRSLDLAKIRHRLEADGVVVVDARVLLIARLEREVTIARDGRILIKSADAREAERLLAQVLSLVGT
ncbi:MAG: hypothetical protein L3J93_00480 [Thermoplasmata archaeon]|nr:hypothetical protein [Thermoplasmata archaeon]